QNASGNDVMVAYTTDGTFGTPVDGTSYSVGNTITGGGEVIYNGSATSFSHTGLTADTRYYYMAWSVDGSTNYSSGVSTDTTTLANEPTADPSGFTATTNSASEITLTWTDASPAADYYLIKGSDVGYTDITDPVDGTPEANGSLVQNVAAGTGTHQFAGLAPNTTYYFQIYPYNGDNGSVNYKTDSPQQASATTDAANTDLIISEVVDPKDVYQARFVELYNLSGSTIDFNTEDWYLCRQTNGGTTWEDKKLTGSITAGGKYVAANYNGSTTDYFYTSYGFMADYDYGGTSGNGDDGYYLYYGGDHSTGTLIDAYGVIDEDGTGKDWEYTDTKAVRLRSVTSPNTTWTASEWNIPSIDQNTTDMTPSAHNEDVTWQGTGTTANDWNEKGGNWSGTYGYIPDASFNVTVPFTTVSPIIYSEAACNNLTLSSDALLDVSPAIPLTVYGNLNVAAAKSRAAALFTIQGDATGNGSVIIKGTVTGNATVQRYFQGYNDGATNGWHLIGSPVNNMAISGTDFDPTGSSDDLYQWNESTDIWENYKQNHFTNFENGKGYLCAFQNNGTKSFTGTLNVSDITVSGLTMDGDGWHILGNPFPSALEWNNGDWTLNNIGGVAKKYDEASGNYLDLAAGAVVPSTNGFFVQATSGGAGVTIPKSARVHNSTVNNFKKGAVNTLKETLTLKVTNDENTYYDLTRIGFKFEATEEWDPAFDSHKLFGDKSAPQLWTIINGDYFSWNNLPYSGEEYNIPLHFKAGVNSTFHITAEGLDGFDGTTQIFLEDLFTGKMTDLTKQQVYDFDGTTDDDEARFILHFNGITAVGETPENRDASVYSYGNHVYIRFRQIPQSGYTVEVFNTMGQQVYTGHMEPNTLNSIRLNEKTGIYIVRVKTSNGIMVQKVMIK
ncbi:MAG: T9SS type A sorting domain-containing protein, partial [Chlorobi bacterium]|nr:T9SS type A sorting domain-containing protein [Chlorobiota bacterium]